MFLQLLQGSDQMPAASVTDVQNAKDGGQFKNIFAFLEWFGFGHGEHNHGHHGHKKNSTTTTTPSAAKETATTIPLKQNQKFLGK